jgi:hypothetical protein
MDTVPVETIIEMNEVGTENLSAELTHQENTGDGDCCIVCIRNGLEAVGSVLAYGMREQDPPIVQVFSCLTLHCRGALLMPILIPLVLLFNM